MHRRQAPNVVVLSKYTKSEDSSGFKTSYTGNTGSTSILCDLYRPGSKPLPGLQSSQNAKPSLIAKYIFNIPQDTRLEMYRERNDDSDDAGEDYDDLLLILDSFWPDKYRRKFDFLKR